MRDYEFRSLPPVQCRLDSIAADLRAYRETQAEKSRTDDLVSLIPARGSTALDIGARDGHFARILREHFDHVVALDLNRPQFSIPGVSNIAGDTTALPFADNSFEFVFCAEVLEHIPHPARAAREITRVAQDLILIGVPFLQDLRLGRTSCAKCGGVSPPWGHINSFDEKTLRALFGGCALRAKSFAGTTKSVTTALAAWLMEKAGNPWGTYDQHEPCVHCGARLRRPESHRSLLRKCCSAAAVRLNAIQAKLSTPRPCWIHILFEKNET
jgi:SAM-dependent methyltransferase